MWAWVGTVYKEETTSHACNEKKNENRKLTNDGGLSCIDGTSPTDLSL